MFFSEFSMQALGIIGQIFFDVKLSLVAFHQFMLLDILLFLVKAIIGERLRQGSKYLIDIKAAELDLRN
jgi:hypothetical protein